MRWCVIRNTKFESIFKAKPFWIGISNNGDLFYGDKQEDAISFFEKEDSEKFKAFCQKRMSNSKVYLDFDIVALKKVL